MSTTTFTPGHTGRVAAWAANRSRTRARLDDAADLIRQGESAHTAARRCGWTPAAAKKAAYRAGRIDLARTFARQAVTL